MTCSWHSFALLSTDSPSLPCFLPVSPPSPSCPSAATTPGPSISCNSAPCRGRDKGQGWQRPDRGQVMRNNSSLQGCGSLPQAWDGSVHSALGSRQEAGAGSEASRGVGRTNTTFSLASVSDRFNELSGLELAVKLVKMTPTRTPVPLPALMQAGTGGANHATRRQVIQHSLFGKEPLPAP